MHHNPEKLSPKREFLIKILICGFIVLTVLAIYWQVRTFDFVNFDDPIYIKNNLIYEVTINSNPFPYSEN